MVPLTVGLGLECKEMRSQLFFTYNNFPNHRMKNEHKKLPVEPKTSKFVSASDLSSEDGENKDPKTKKAPGRPGVSRLPVLAKTVCLQTPSNFSQTHCKWEDKSLAVSDSCLF